MKSVVVPTLRGSSSRVAFDGTRCSGQKRSNAVSRLMVDSRQPSDRFQCRWRSSSPKASSASAIHQDFGRPSDQQVRVQVLNGIELPTRCLLPFLPKSDADWMPGWKQRHRFSFGTRFWLRGTTASDVVVYLGRAERTPMVLSRIRKAPEKRRASSSKSRYALCCLLSRFA